jgi:hypothetical protein
MLQIILVNFVMLHVLLVLDQLIFNVLNVELIMEHIIIYLMELLNV